jgi:hypothetical protein
MTTRRTTFDALRSSLENNMKHVYRLDQVNESQAGHYPVAIMVLVGAEALSHLQGRNDGAVFVEMMAVHDVEALLAQKLFDALRNGIAHWWDTKFLDVGSEKVELFISWEKQRHLTMSEGRLYLNAWTMWEDLQSALAKYAVVLESNPEIAKASVEPQITSLTDSPEIRQAWRRFEKQRGEGDGPTW